MQDVEGPEGGVALVLSNPLPILCVALRLPSGLMAFDILQPDQLYHLIKRSDADQVILDVRSRRQAYLAGHIPGAVHTTWEVQL
jgi:hypothetical protein